MTIIRVDVHVTGLQLCNDNYDILYNKWLKLSISIFDNTSSFIHAAYHKYIGTWFIYVELYGFLIIVSIQLNRVFTFSTRLIKISFLNTPHLCSIALLKKEAKTIQFQNILNLISIFFPYLSVSTVWKSVLMLFHYIGLWYYVLSSLQCSSGWMGVSNFFHVQCCSLSYETLKKVPCVLIHFSSCIKNPFIFRANFGTNKSCMDLLRWKWDSKCGGYIHMIHPFAGMFNVHLFHIIGTHLQNTYVVYVAVLTKWESDRDSVNHVTSWQDIMSYSLKWCHMETAS